MARRPRIRVYLGLDPYALPLVGTTSSPTYTPAELTLDATQYWQVVEVNGAEAINVWTGDVWSFTTEQYIELEDFEVYTDNSDAGEAIWQAWIDGIEDNTNGFSYVGNDPSPFA